MSTARLSPSGKWVECGACSTPLCQRSLMVLATGERPVHVLIWAPEWRNDDPRWLYRGPRIKRGWVPTVGTKAKPWKSFGYDLPARCICGALNTLDPSALGVADVPRREA